MELLIGLVYFLIGYLVVAITHVVLWSMWFAYRRRRFWEAFDLEVESPVVQLRMLEEHLEFILTHLPPEYRPWK